MFRQWGKGAARATEWENMGREGRPASNQAGHIEQIAGAASSQTEGIVALAGRLGRARQESKAMQQSSARQKAGIPSLTAGTVKRWASVEVRSERGWQSYGCKQGRLQRNGRTAKQRAGCQKRMLLAEQSYKARAQRVTSRRGSSPTLLGVIAPTRTAAAGAGPPS